jgi:hypothetical protein
MTSHSIFKVSVAASSKSGAFVTKDLGAARHFYQSINSGLKNDPFPELPDHELFLPKDGWLEDFILGDFGNPYVSSRAAELLNKEWGDDLEFMPLKVDGQANYHILIVRPPMSSINGKPCLVNGEIDYDSFLDEAISNVGVFRIAGREKALFATNAFGAFIQKHLLTGVYLRDPKLLLKKTVLPFGLPIMKNKQKPILEG